MYDNIFNFYSDLTVTENNNLPKNCVLDISQDDEAYANLCSTINTLKHNLYQDAEFSNIVNAISECGLDRSLLFMYNRNNELSRMTSIHIPSLEEFDNGYRLSNDETNLLLCDMIKHVYFAGQEGFASDAFQAILADIAAPAAAGARWFQTIIDKPKKLSDKIEHAIDTIKRSKVTKFSDRSISMIPLDNIKKVLNRNDDLIEEANEILLDVCSGKIKSDDVIEAGNRMKKICMLAASNTTATIAHISDSSVERKLSSISPNELIKLGEEAIKKLDSIEKMNKTYPGFFHTGWSVGKLHGVLGYLLPILNGINIPSLVWKAASAIIHRGYITTATYGWDALTTAVHSDMRVCNAIAKILNEAADDCAK